MHQALKEQGLHPYHVQKVQALESADFPHHVIYGACLLQQCRERPNLLNCILFTDEAGFSRNAVFSSHNIWSDEIHNYNFNDGIVNDRLVGPYLLQTKFGTLSPVFKRCVERAARRGTAFR